MSRENIEIRLIKDGKERTELYIEGRIDSTNADAFEEEVMKYEASFKDGRLVFDMKKLDYISSAGLRALKRIMGKTQARISALNVQSKIRDIFEVTGFDNLMDVHRPMKHVSTEGCRRLGRGYNGEVFQLDPDTIIKVFFPGVTLDMVRREQETARAVFLAGLPVVIPYDTVRVGKDRYGIMFEMLGTKTLSEIMASDPDHFEEWLDKYAELYKGFHEKQGNFAAFLKTKDVYDGYLDESASWYTAEELQKLRDFVHSIPDRGTLIHGDFHPNNIMVQNGELLTIDVGDVSMGHPVFDLLATAASQANLVELAPEQAEFHTRMPAALIKRGWKGLIDRYFADCTEEERKRRDSQIRLLSKLKVACTPAVGKGAPEELIRASVNDAKENLIPKLDELTGTIDW